MSFKRLNSEYQSMIKDPNYFFSCVPTQDNILIWNFSMIGPPDSLYEYGVFNGRIEFSQMYPHKPPSIIFNNIIHPNIYIDGKVCISILHEGVDESGYETASDRWNPSHNINTIMMSILSLLLCPNFDSPANIDAKNLWQNNKKEYKKIIYDMIKKQ